MSLAVATRSRARRSAALAGGAVFLVSATAVHLGNYAFNVVMGRWLGPAAFAELSLVVTMLLVATVVTTTLELAAARQTAVLIARGEDPEPVRRLLGRIALSLGLAGAVVLTVGSPWVAELFGSPSIWPFVLFAGGLPAYLTQGVHRGLLQGQARFGRLAASFQAEMWVRLLAGTALVALGAGVVGAVAGVTLSSFAAWLVASPRRPSTVTVPTEVRRATLGLVRSAGVLLLGQVLIANSDVLVVKAAFPAAVAGRYAAVALIGRAVFFGSWSVVSLAFPYVASRVATGGDDRRLLAITAGSVATIGASATAVAAVAPEIVLDLLFGGTYPEAAGLLWPYALATTLFAVANAVVNHDLAAGRPLGARLVLAAGVVQALALVAHHPDPAAVVTVQVGLMAALLLTVLAARQRPGGRP